jgi:hypothetical protein
VNGAASSYSFIEHEGQPLAGGETEDGHRAGAHGAVRHVGIGRNLTLKLGRPVPGNNGAAIPTRAIAGEEIAGDQVTVAPDQQRMAAGTIGVLQITDLSWQIACVEIPQALCLAIIPNVCTLNELTNASSEAP